MATAAPPLFNPLPAAGWENTLYDSIVGTTRVIRPKGDKSKQMTAQQFYDWNLDKDDFAREYEKPEDYVDYVAKAHPDKFEVEEIRPSTTATQEQKDAVIKKYLFEKTATNPLNLIGNVWENIGGPLVSAGMAVIPAALRGGLGVVGATVNLADRSNRVYNKPIQAPPTPPSDNQTEGMQPPDLSSTSVMPRITGYLYDRYGTPIRAVRTVLEDPAGVAGEAAAAALLPEMALRGAAGVATSNAARLYRSGKTALAAEKLAGAEKLTGAADTISGAANWMDPAVAAFRGAQAPFKYGGKWASEIRGGAGLYKLERVNELRAAHGKNPVPMTAGQSFADKVASGLDYLHGGVINKYSASMGIPWDMKDRFRVKMGVFATNNPNTTAEMADEILRNAGIPELEAKNALRAKVGRTPTEQAPLPMTEAQEAAIEHAKHVRGATRIYVKTPGKAYSATESSYKQLGEEADRLQKAREAIAALPEIKEIEVNPQDIENLRRKFRGKILEQHQHVSADYAAAVDDAVDEFMGNFFTPKSGVPTERKFIDPNKWGPNIQDSIHGGVKRINIKRPKIVNGVEIPGKLETVSVEYEPIKMTVGDLIENLKGYNKDNKQFYDQIAQHGAEPMQRVKYEVRANLADWIRQQIDDKIDEAVDTAQDVMRNGKAESMAERIKRVADRSGAGTLNLDVGAGRVYKQLGDEMRDIMDLQDTIRGARKRFEMQPVRDSSGYQTMQKARLVSGEATPGTILTLLGYEARKNDLYSTIAGRILSEGYRPATKLRVIDAAGRVLDTANYRNPYGITVQPTPAPPTVENKSNKPKAPW